MLIVAESGGIQVGGINFDAKIRRNSTDNADLFQAHIGGMDTFARAWISAETILNNSEDKELSRSRYANFGSAHGKRCEAGDLTLEDLRAYAIDKGEPAVRSGKQELFENIINRYI